MIKFFGALSLLFAQLADFSDYFTERTYGLYSELSEPLQTGVMILSGLMVLLILYLFKIIARINFNNSTRKLVNVRREYQITLNRAEGKRCNFVWDILLYQKMIIIDEPVLIPER